MAATSSPGRARRLVISATVALVILALALGLGLGLGLKHHHHTSDSQASGSGNGSSGGSGNTTTSRNLTVVSVDQLVNASQFYLDPLWDFNAAPTTRVYNWTISEVISSPGAIYKRMIVVNGQSPGPNVEANLGDRLIINVKNNLENSTAIHWHGQYQNGTNFYDGTFGVTQCGIPGNGGLMTYNFTVANVGTYWYHAHRSTQYTDGLYGALILHSPNETARTKVHYDEEAVIMMADFYNTFSQDLLTRYLRYGTGIDGQPGDEPAGDGGVINGISQASCAYLPATDSTLPERRRRRSLLTKRNPPGQGDQPVIAENNTCIEGYTPRYASFDLKKGKAYRLRLINTGSFSGMHFSIDNHPLTVIEADGVSIEPRVVQSLLIGVAQRYSVVVRLDKDVAAYWIRADIDADQLTYTSPSFNSTTFAVLRYDGVNNTLLPPNTTAPDLTNTKASNVSAELDYAHDLIPADKMNAPDPTKQVQVSISMQYDSTGNFRAFFNNTSWEPLTTSSTLFGSIVASPSAYTPDASQFVVTSESIETVDFIVNSFDDGQHPFHLHGHTFFVVGQGTGRYTGQTLNSTNPMRRDTILLEPYSWIALRFVTDNPGLWAFHCHIAWHMESGLLMQFSSLPAKTAGLDVPRAMLDMCSKQ